MAETTGTTGGVGVRGGSGAPGTRLAAIPSAASLVAALRPNVASMGYALFLAVNAAGVWGGVFPFLPLDFQTSTIVFWFFLAQSLAFAVGFFLNALIAYRWPVTARSFIVKLTVVPYMAGWALLIAATYADAAALPLVTAGGALLGVGSAEFYTLWQRLFASQEPEVGSHDLMLGTAYAAVLYFALYLIPVAVTAFLIPLVFLPLFGLAIVLRSRGIDLDQPMFEDVPREHPAVYRRAVAEVWRSAFCVGGLGLCAGVMRSLAIAEPAVGSLVNALSMGALLVAALALLACWRLRGLRLNVVTIYRVFFPFAITGLLALPFLGTGYARWLAAALYALYSVGIVLMMAQCAQMSRDSGINPVFIYGVFAGIVYALHDVGFIAGSLGEALGGLASAAGLAGAAGVAGSSGEAPVFESIASALESIPSDVLVALVAVYLLGLIYFLGQGGFRGAFQAGRGAASEGIELVAPTRRDMGGVGGLGVTRRPASSARARQGVLRVGGVEEDAARPLPDSSQAHGATVGRPLGSLGVCEGAGRGPDAVGGAVGPEEAARVAAEGFSPGIGGPRGGTDVAGFAFSAMPEEEAAGGAQGDGRRGSRGAAHGDASPQFRDRASKQVEALRRHYGLSAREAEVMELMARGGSVPRIAEQLVVSENTIRTHSKRIYAKLDIHKKQDLIDLINEFDPSQLGTR